MNERILLMRLKHKNERALTEVIERYTVNNGELGFFRKYP